MKFDPESAKLFYARKDTDELLRIAFLEETYLDAAKELAKSELKRRGLTDLQEKAENLRKYAERMEAAELETAYGSEKSFGPWLQRLRAWAASHPRLVHGAVLTALIPLGLDGLLFDELLPIAARQSQGLAMLVSLIAYLLWAPTSESIEEEREKLDR